MAFRTPKDVDRRFTRKLKDDIRRKGLLDTGALYSSIDVTAEIDYNVASFMTANYTFTVKVYAEVYLVYLNERFQVTNDFINSRSFANTTDRFRIYFSAYLKNEYPLLNFDNITLSPSEIILMNQP
jgi:hypothetical protein